MDTIGPRTFLTMGERDVGLTEIPALWTRTMDAVAGKLQYRHATGHVAWTPIEVTTFEMELARRRAVAAQRTEQPTQPPQPHAPQYPAPTYGGSSSSGFGAQPPPPPTPPGGFGGPGAQ
eukprot:690755-Alexandrium_andersonii.AAC.1